MSDKLPDLIERLYTNPACLVGGPLHIVVDDGNVEDHMIRWCCEIEQITDWQDAALPYNDPANVAQAIADSFTLAAALLAVTEDERSEALGFPVQQ